MKTIEIREDCHKWVIKQVAANLFEVTLYEDMSYLADQPRWVALGNKELCRREFIAEEYGIAI